jgi:hypothetical protein
MVLGKKKKLNKKMFEKEDFDHIQKMQNSMADGMTDGSDSHSILEKIVDLFSHTDFTSDESRMEMMMNCINLCYEDEDGEAVLVEDNVFGVVLGLCFNYSNILSNLITDGFQTEDYYNFLKDEILPVMREESKSLPYWDIEDE